MTAAILDVAAVAQASVTGVESDPRAYLLAFHPDASIPPLTHVVATAEPMVARVNHGRWIASCSCGAKGLPRPGCLISLANPLGWCVQCGNRAWGGGWRHVTMPSADERQQIEAVLLCRPNVEDRNWEPHESVADLMVQNREHGDPVPTLLELAAPPLGPSWRDRAAPFRPLPKLEGRLRRLAGRFVKGR